MKAPIGGGGSGRPPKKKPPRQIRDSGVANNPRPRHIDKSPTVTKTVTRAPVTDVQSGRRGHPYRSAPTPPPASWRHPLAPVRVAPRKPPSRTLAQQVRPLVRPPLALPSVQQAAAALRFAEIQAQQRKRIATAQQTVTRQLGLSMGPYPNPYRLHDSIPQFQQGTPAPALRDSGVANNPVPRVRGVVLSPQQIQQDMGDLFRHPKAAGKSRILERLQAAGVLDVKGTTTDLQRRETERTYRRELLDTLVAKQSEFQNFTGEGSGPREIRMMLERLPTSELERLTKWQPSELEIAGGQVNTSGFSLEGLSQFAGGIGGTVSGTIRGALPDGSVSDLLANAAGDLIEIPGEAVPSLYYAASPLASGDVGEAVKRFVQPFEGLLPGNIGESFGEHPLGTALMATGAVRGVGRGTGFALRHGTPRMRDLGSTNRGVAVLPGTKFEERRRYSPDAFVKPFQVRSDLRKSEKARKLYIEANEAETKAVQAQQHGGNSEQLFKVAAHKRHQAYRMDPGIITDQQKVGTLGKTALQRALDEDEALYENLRRLDRSRVIRDGTKALGRKPSALTRPVVEGIVAAARNDVEKYLAEIVEEAKSLDPEIDRPKLLANEQLQGQLRKALDDPKTDMGKVTAAAERYIAVAMPLQAELKARNLIAPGRADRAALTSYAVREMGARHDPAHYVTHDGVRITDSEAKSIQANHPTTWKDHIVHIPDRVVGPHGRSFSTAEIQAHIAGRREAGVPFVENPQYVSQQPNLRSASAYFRRWNPRAGIQSGLRTGKAVLQGLFDAHPSTLIDQLARTQSLISADKAFQGHLDQFGYRTEQGRLFTAGTKRAATEMKDALEAHGSPVKWREIRLNPLGANPDALTALLDATDAQAHVARQRLHSTLEDAFSGKDGDGPWALIPEEVANRAADHQKLLGSQAGVKAVQKISSMFRRVVLARPSFLFGNTFEASVRGLLKGALPGTPDYFMMRRVLDALPAADRDSVLHGPVGSGHMGMAARANMHRPVDQLGQGRVASAAQGVAHTPPARMIVKAWDTFNHVYFTEINSRIERQFRIAIMGKELRQDLFPHKLLVLSKQSIREAADGLTNTPKQRMYGRAVDRAYGQYDKFTPEQRRWLMLYTPFAAWMLNSIRFALQVLPKDHPVVTGLLAAATQTSQDWRDAHGLTQVPGKNIERLPGFLQGTIPGDRDSHLRTATRFTPFGFWADPLAAVGTAVLPQFSGVEAAFNGTDWKGKPLEDQSFFGKAEEAGKEFAGAILPFFGQGEQISQGGVRKFFDPFMFTQSSAPSRKRRGGGGSSSVMNVLDSVTSSSRGGDVDPSVLEALDEALGG